MRVLQLFAVLFCVAAELTDHLWYFETLHHLDLKVRKKRSLDGYDSTTKDLSFTAFGRSFNLVLTPGSPVVSADFKAKMVYKDGQTVALFVRENDFYTGHLSEDETVNVDAYVEDGVWAVSIYDIDDVYTLEPSWRHLPPSDNHSMIAYRHSDIKWDNIFPDLAKAPNNRSLFCHGIHPEDDPNFSQIVGRDDEKKISEETNSTRFKRAVPEQNTCQILAVADYTFFNGIGGGSPHKTAINIIQTMQKVDRIYRSTVWNDEEGLVDMGLQIKELRIHTEVTDPNSYHRNGRHYNMYDENWHYNDLLKQFGEDDDVEKFCLAHLFTYRRFQGGVLGLAYIAGARRDAVGGICSERRWGEKSYNTGFSSSMNTKGKNLLSQEAMIVTAHEFGHNWGSEHDAETDECAPSGFKNGRFIMFAYAVSGYDENNDVCFYVITAVCNQSGKWEGEEGGFEKDCVWRISKVPTLA